MFRWRTTYHWKALDEGYNFALDLIPIGGLHTKLWPQKVMAPQSRRSPNFGNWESRDKMSFKCEPRGEAQNIL
jgi:hypothetical protein